MRILRREAGAEHDDLRLINLRLDPHVLGIGQIEDRLVLAKRDPLIDWEHDTSPPIGLVDVDDNSIAGSQDRTILDVFPEPLEPLFLELESRVLREFVGLDRLDFSLQRLDDSLGPFDP